MNELAHIIKSLGYSLTVVPASTKCIESLAKHHDMRSPLERLHKGVMRHKSEGYDLETKKVAIEPTALSVLDRLQSQDLKITDIQKQCHLLTSLEKSSLGDFCQSILDKMEARAEAAQAILDAMSKNGIQVDDLK